MPPIAKGSVRYSDTMAEQTREGSEYKLMHFVVFKTSTLHRRMMFDRDLKVLGYGRLKYSLIKDASSPAVRGQSLRDIWTESPLGSY